MHMNKRLYQSHFFKIFFLIWILWKEKKTFLSKTKLFVYQAKRCAVTSHMFPVLFCAVWLCVTVTENFFNETNTFRSLITSTHLSTRSLPVSEGITSLSQTLTAELCKESRALLCNVLHKIVGELQGCEKTLFSVYRRQSKILCFSSQTFILHSFQTKFSETKMIKMLLHK